MMKRNGFTRRDAIKLGGALAAGAMLPGNALADPVSVTVGDPAHGSDLPGAIQRAYGKGVRSIKVTPGTYTVGGGGRAFIELSGWKDAVIDFQGSTVIFDGTQRPVMLSGCEGVMLMNATLRYAGLSWTQGRITARATDDKGEYVDWQIDAGYPTELNDSEQKTYWNVIDQKTRLLKLTCGDNRPKDRESRGKGQFRFRGLGAGIGNAAVGDWMVCRVHGGSSIVQMDESRQCVVKKVILQNAGFAAFYETGGDGAHRYEDCRVMRGPKPAGATEEQLVSVGADGFHSNSTRVGPTIIRCAWGDGALLDDCIAIHGRLQDITRSVGNMLVFDKGKNPRFQVGDPVRVTGENGLFAQAKCVAVGPAADGGVQVTLDTPIAAPPGSWASNPNRCGKDYRIIDCTLGNTRSRGIIVKGDGGVIQGCTVTGCGMSAVSIGPEHTKWGEGDYSWDVTVEKNVFRHNALGNKGAEVVFLHGDGGIGNRRIKIVDNVFDANYGTCVGVNWTDGAEVTGNTVRAASPLGAAEKGYFADISHARNVTVKGNTMPVAAGDVEPVSVGEDVVGVVKA